MPDLRTSQERKPDISTHIELCAVVQDLDDAPVGFTVFGIGDPAAAPPVSVLHQCVGDGEALFTFLSLRQPVHLSQTGSGSSPGSRYRESMVATSVSPLITMSMMDLGLAVLSSMVFHRPAGDRESEA